MIIYNSYTVKGSVPLLRSIDAGTMFSILLAASLLVDQEDNILIQTNDNIWL